MTRLLPDTFTSITDDSERVFLPLPFEPDLDITDNIEDLIALVQAFHPDPRTGLAILGMSIGALLSCIRISDNTPEASAQLGNKIIRAGQQMFNVAYVGENVLEPAPEPDHG